ncbi:peptidoglycan editing factor PgeF [Paenibacillus yanchengensis]|uniref:Purine nucleoside phosphorylase n=1 Tax=Paenibacillus yanchengensis TaxID=2035833 RepID=A0ABW4YKG4_9BACL
MEPFVPMESAERISLFNIDKWMQHNKRLTVGFTGRQGGSSSGEYRSLNMGLHVGDDAPDVIANRKLVSQAIMWPFTAWTCTEQVHSNRVCVIDQALRGKGKDSHHDAIKKCDALITNEVGTLLVSYYADCVPLFFYDKVHSAIGLAHAGWRGTVQEIAKETIEAMTKHYGTDPAQLQVAIGPSIGQCCYEVDQSVISEVERLANRYQVNPAEQKWIETTNSSGKAQIDLKEINRQIMMEAGILPIHIELTTYCTGCRTDLFFSHRMENGKTGRMASWIGLTEGE